MADNGPGKGLDANAAEEILKAMAGAFMGQLTRGLRPARPRPSEETRYRALVEQMPAIVFMAYLDAPASEAFISPQIEPILGYSRNEWVDDPVRWYYRIHPDDRARWSDEAAGLFSGAQPLRSTYRVIARDGGLVWLRCDVRLVRDDEGQPWFVHGVAFDITEVERAQQSLLQKSAELQAANRELESFSYSVAHDLRSPLRAVASFTDLLLRRAGPSLDAAAKGYLAQIRASGARMSELIDALLNLSRITRSEMAVETIELGPLVEEIFGRLRAEEPQRAVRLTLAPGLLTRGDRALVRILLENLLRNAWKFTAKSPEPAIEVGKASRHGRPAFYVRDNGVGFDMTYSAKLFKPFNRLHSAGDFPGSGIGLAISDRIVRRHGGEMWAEASPGRGATFYFTLT